MSERRMPWLMLVCFLALSVCCAGQMPHSGEPPTTVAGPLPLLEPATGFSAGEGPLGTVDLPPVGGISPDGEGPAVPSGALPSAGSSPASTLLAQSAFPATGTVVVPAQIGQTGLTPSAGLSLGLEQAVNGALQRNQGLQVRRIDVDLSREDVAAERAAFDGHVAGSLSNSDRLGKQIQQSGALGDNVSNRTDAALSLERKGPSGTSTVLGMTIARNRSARAANLFNTRLSLDLTHPLRQGAGRQVNLVAVRQAELDVTASRQELDAFVTALVADVQQTYWTLYLAARELEIYNDSHRLALMQLDETGKKIKVGTISESELAAAEAEVAMREEDLINAQSQLETRRIAFLRLINPDPVRFWSFPISLVEELPTRDPELPPPEELVKKALARRPEISQAQTLLEKGELEIVRTRNGLLPKLDFFATLGKSGYASSLEKSSTEIGMKAYDLTAGLEFDISSGRREARALDRKARASQKQREIALENLRQLVAQDVLTAYLEVNRATKQIHATAKTVEKQLEKLRVEEVKFGLGKTTAFQVAQAQRDVAASLIAALKARIGLTTALIDLARYDGSLCEGSGITVE